MGSEANIQLNLPSEIEAQAFFKKEVGVPELNDVAKQIVAECECLPIALATVGAALRNKGEDEWKDALDKLKHARLVDIYGINDEDRNTYKCLQLSYDYLKHSTEVQFMLLLCSLFPEDHKIDLEDLTRCAFGMELFERVEIIEDARRQVRIAVQILKDSCLLLGTDSEKCVKVHDMVRDAVLWIGGKEAPERNVFTVRDGRDLKELMKRKSFQNCRAISFMADSLPALSNYELVCPNLEAILIFGGDEDGFGFELPDKFFKHMKLVKVLALRSAGKWTKCRFAMPRSLQYLTHLRTLILRYCECLNSSILRELGNLEILSLEGSNIDCGVEVVMALRKLRLLDLSPLNVERMFPSNIIETFLKLEELYNYYFGECVAEGINYGGSLSELELLANLVVLFTKVENVRCLPKDFCFPDLQRYNIHVGENLHRELHDSGRRSLVLEGIEDESVIINTFKKLLPAVQDLYLKGCNHLCSLSALYSHSEGFLQDLGTLEVEDCNKMEWVFEFEGDQVISDSTIVHLQLLKILRLGRLPALKQIQRGPSSMLSLCNVTQVEMEYCSKLTCIFPSPSNLQQLEILTVRRCGNLIEIIGSSGDEDDVSCYPNLRIIQIEECANLKTIFSAMEPPSTARPQSHSRLPKLQQLHLMDNAKMKHVFGNETRLEVEREFPQMEELRVQNCPQMSTLFAATHLQASSSKTLKKISCENNNGPKETRQLCRQDDVLPLSSVIYFSPLQRAHLISGNKSQHVFKTSLVTNSVANAPSSLRPKEIILGDSQEVEEIIELPRQDDTGLSAFHWEKLHLCKPVGSGDCGELKPIFPTVIDLWKLLELYLESNAELEHVNGQSYWDQCSESSTLVELTPPTFAGTVKQLEIVELSDTVEEIIELQRHGDQPLTSDLTLMKTEGDNIMVDDINSVQKFVSPIFFGGNVATLSAPTDVALEANNGKDEAATAFQDLCEIAKR